MPADLKISTIPFSHLYFYAKPYKEEYLISRINSVLMNKELRAKSSLSMGMEIYFSGQKYKITSDRFQMIDRTDGRKGRLGLVFLF